MQIDLSTLPPPEIVETLDFEAVLEGIKADLIERFPDIEPTLRLESTVVNQLLQVVAYREVLIRARINDAALALLLARAQGGDLDQIAANFDVPRLAVDYDGNGDPIMESDERLRRRVLIAIEAYSVAGPAGAYIFHALTEVPALRDATAVSEEPGHVIVTLMQSEAEPTPTVEQRQTVALALSSNEVRPLTDIVSVLPPDVVEVEIEAELTIYPGPDGTVVAQNAEARLTAWLTENAYLGRDLRRSAIFSRLHVDGVQSVNLLSPAADVVIGPREAIKITGISVTVTGVDE